MDSWHNSLWKTHWRSSCVCISATPHLRGLSTNWNIRWPRFLLAISCKVTWRTKLHNVVIINLNLYNVWQLHAVGKWFVSCHVRCRVSCGKWFSWCVFFFPTGFNGRSCSPGEYCWLHWFTVCYRKCSTLLVGRLVCRNHFAQFRKVFLGIFLGPCFTRGKHGKVDRLNVSQKCAENVSQVSVI